MQTETQSEITQTTSKTIPLKTEHMGRWFKISLFTTLGLLSILFLILLGLSLSKNQNSSVQQPIAVQPTSVPTAVVTPLAISVSSIPVNWKTYSSKKYTFKYPDGWILEEKCSKLGYSADFPCVYSPNFSSVTEKVEPGEAGIDTLTKYNIGTLFAADLLQNVIYYPNGGFCMPGGPVMVTNCQEKTINGVKFATRELGDSPYPTNSINAWLVRDNDAEANLSFSFSKEDKIADLQIFDQILSTFKFIESDSTANLKTYRSPFIGDYVYPFELSYSSEWTLDSKITSEDPKSLMVKLTKSDGSAINITQGMGGGGTCIYYDESDFETFEGMGGSFKSYVQLTKPALWRIGLDGEDSKYVVCEKVPNSRYLDGTKIGWINIVLKSDTSVQEIKKIFESIVFKPTSTTKTSFD